MKFANRLWLKGFVLMMSILVSGAAALLAETKEPGPFEKFFHWVGNGFEKPQRKTSTHHSTQQRQTAETQASPSANAADQVPRDGSNKPPSERNTRSASRASAKKGEDLPYATPVPGKQGFVTSPFSPNSGYIDVRGFAPGTPVKDPYTGKVFLTP
jgi:hypothetical protein